MRGSRIVATMTVGVVLFAALVASMSSGTAHEEEAPKAAKKAKNAQKKAQAAQKTAALARKLSENAVSFNITFGLLDAMPKPWNGSVALSEGKLVAIDIIRGGGQMARIEGNQFFIRSTRPGAKQNMPVVKPELSVIVEAPPVAKITVDTPHGQFSFLISDLQAGKERLYLEGAVSVTREDAALRMTGPETEDDFPVLARGKDETLWLAYVEYRPSEPVLPERIFNGNFELLVPSGHGDKILLRRFDGKEWQDPLDVTAGGLDIWRPAITVDGQGRVCIAWSEQKDGNWDIYFRRYDPQANTWSAVERLTTDPGTDYQVVLATDALGAVWLAWQAWRKDNFDVLAARMGTNPGDKLEVQPVAQTAANDWSPSIAADSLGHVYVAYDTYEAGNYDVRLARLGKDPETRVIAATAKFEARPSLLCDATGRVWIAYEEGEEQWGKDYSTNEFRKIPFEKNLGSALYTTRTLRLKCIEKGAVVVPAADLETAWAGRLTRGKSVPRLALDGSGGLWLFLRHHPLPGGAGEVWNSFAMQFDGNAWSIPRRLPHSENLMDNRPALAASGKGLVTVYSGDRRASTQTRGQDDLFAVTLPGPEKVEPPKLVPEPAAPAPQLASVHPNESEDLRRIRGYRVEAGGKKLQLVRGDFHRHTEYSAHRDQDGLLEDSFRYGLDAGNLDWMGNGDHDNGFHHEYMWWLIQKTTDLFRNPPRFVSMQSYERSNVYPNGHRNVIMPRRGILPLIRGDLKAGTPETGTPDTKLLYAYLRHFGGMCASHTSATSMGTDWRDNDSDVEPVVEIYQGHRHNYEHFGAPRSPTKETQIGGYEPAGFVWNALEKGYRLGFQSSSDHISTHISFAVVITEDFSREGVIAAFKKRHSYAATDNIVFDVHCADNIMGDIFETKDRPTLAIHIEGTGPIAKLDVIRDNKYVYTTEPKTQNVDLKYTDTDIQPGKTSYYYVRIQQADGNLAWASPMWITYKP